MRKASEVVGTTFPYDSSLVGYIYVSDDGKTYQVGSDISYQYAYDNATSDKGHIVAVWPGKWSSDAFEIDDLKAFGLAKNCVKEDLELEIVGWNHSTSKYDTKFSQAIDFYVRWEDDDIFTKTPNFGQRFADMIYDKFGFEWVSSKGYGGSYSAFDKIKTISCYIKNTHHFAEGEHWGEQKAPLIVNN